MLAHLKGTKPSLKAGSAINQHPTPFLSDVWDCLAATELGLAWRSRQAGPACPLPNPKRTATRYTIRYSEKSRHEGLAVTYWENGGPGEGRTPNLLLRRQALYPVEL